MLRLSEFNLTCKVLMKVLKNMPCFLEDSLSIFIEREIMRSLEGVLVTFN